MGFTEPHVLASVFSGLSPTAIANAIGKVLLSGFFRSLLAWVAGGAASIIGLLGGALSSTTEPVLSAAAFRSEFDVMAALGAAVALPLLALAAIQAVVRQEPGALLRSAFVRLPLALLFTWVSVQIVALALSATDQASTMVLSAGGDPAAGLLRGLGAALSNPDGFGLAAFGSFLLVLTASAVGFLLWIELAVRSAAIAAASLFLPLALVGTAWPATAHWPRRLGETLAALVLSKLVIAAVIALAAGLLVSPNGVSGLVEGVALLAVASFAPFALLRLVPIVEAGAVTQLDGLGRRSIAAAQRLAPLAGDGIAFLENLGVSATAADSSRPSLEMADPLRMGPFHDNRPGHGASGTPPPPLDQDYEWPIVRTKDAPQGSTDPGPTGGAHDPGEATDARHPASVSAGDDPVGGAGGGAGS